MLVSNVMSFIVTVEQLNTDNTEVSSLNHIHVPSLMKFICLVVFFFICLLWQKTSFTTKMICSGIHWVI